MMDAHETSPERHEKPMTLDEIRMELHAEEEMGFDAPFTTFTWRQWEAMPGQLLNNLNRFQRAIEQRRAERALFAALEMQQVIIDLLKEACSWVSLSTDEH